MTTHLKNKHLNPTRVALRRLALLLVFAWAVAGCHREKSPVGDSRDDTLQGSAENGSKGSSTDRVEPSPTEAIGTTSQAVVVVPTPQALLVVGATPLTGGDLALSNRLSTNLGYTVTAVTGSAATSANANGKALVVISESVTDTQVNTKFKASTVPVVVLEPLLFDDMSLTLATLNTDFGTRTGQSQVAITSASQPMAGGLSGNVTVTTSNQTFGWGKPAAGTVAVATIVGNSNQTAIFGFTTGTAMASSFVAPARRVGWFASAAAMNVFNASGWTLFDAAIRWATQPEALLVTASATLTAGETAIKNRLEGTTLNMGVRVLTVSAVTAANAVPAQLIVVSDTGAAATLGTKLTTVAEPILTLNAATFGAPTTGNLQLTGPTSGTDFGTTSAQTQIDIAKSTHSLAGGLTGRVTLTAPGQPAQTFQWGNSIATGAVKVATIVGNTSRAAIFGYPKGALLKNGTPAPARRVGFWASSAALAGSVPSASTWTLFDAAVNWAKNPGVDSACESVVDGTACNDGDGCTQTDTCVNQVCTGSNPKVCTASDQCHVGTCNPANGTCSNINAPNGTNCNDNNACSTGETCQSGTCGGGSSVSCTTDACHTIGACVPATGCPAAVAKPNGTTCSDSDACTAGETCQTGVCGGGSAVSCTTDDCHTIGACVPATGCPAPVVKPGAPGCNTDWQLPSLSVVPPPASGTAGRIVRASDQSRGLWMDTGSQWFSLSGGVLDVREFGARGNGTTADDAAIQAALVAAPSGGTLSFGPGEYRVSTSFSVGSSVALRFTTGAVLKLDPGVTLTINGPLQAPDSQIFRALGDASSGTISFGTTSHVTKSGNGFIEHVNPRWWGATSVLYADYCTSSFAAFQAALNTDKSVFVPNGVFNLGILDGCSPAGTAQGLVMRGDGQALFGNSTVHGNMLRYGAPSGTAITTGNANQSINHIYLSGNTNDPSYTSVGIRAGSGSRLQLDNSFIDYFYEALSCDATSSVFSSGLNIVSTTHAAVSLNGTRGARFTNFKFGTGLGHGVAIAGGAEGNSFDNGRIATTGTGINGISISASHRNSFNNLVISVSGRAGVHIDGGSNGNTVQHSFISSSGAGVASPGVEVGAASGTKIVNNSIIDTTRTVQTYGVHLTAASKGTIVSNNILSPNVTGAILDESGTHNRAFGNSENNETSLEPSPGVGDTTRMKGTFVFKKQVSAPSWLIASNKFSYGSAPTEMCSQGSIRWNVGASPDGRGGWICVAGGLWRPFGVVSGSCVNQPDGTPCDDSNACTLTDRCTSGICTPGPRIPCPAQDQCHTAGTCDPASGACSNPVATVGTACDDGNACNAGDTCDAAGVCQSGSTVAHCQNALKDCNETDVDCGGGCTSCGQHNTCTANTDCDPSLGCFGNHCECVPNCSAATCANPSNGCGGECPEVCTNGQQGCTLDVHCPAGSTCIESPDGLRTCRPTDTCAYRFMEPPLCGSPDAPCGATCPECPGQCAGRQCGNDPKCGVNCGTCSGGTYCNIDGQCAASANEPPIMVPDGQGGQRAIVDLLPRPTSTVGALKGSFGVSEMGTAEYRVPIEVPPGRAGMEPTLSLAYESTRRNGDLGIGWHLEGLTSITRCPRTYAMDGYAGPVTNSSKDRFCLDGQRLMNLSSSGSYGQNGTEYRTVVDSFAKIISYDESGPRVYEHWSNVTILPRPEQGPDYFKVWSKDGRILTYGREDATVTARNGLNHAWLLSRIEDRAGNTIVVRYSNLGAAVPAQNPTTSRRLVRPEAISYTGHGTDPGNREVRFTYENRPDPLVTYRQGGVPDYGVGRLKRVSTYLRGGPVKSYRIDYDLAGQIGAIAECTHDDDAVCKTWTTFIYEQAIGFERGSQAPVKSLPGIRLDVNGDGIADILRQQASGSYADNSTLSATETTVDIGLTVVSLAGGPVSWTALFAQQMLPAFFGTLGADMNFSLNNSVALSTNTRVGGGQRLVNNVQGLSCTLNSPLVPVDYNQDGKDDIIAMCKTGDDANSVIWTPRLALAKGDGSGNFVPATVTDGNDSPLIFRVGNYSGRYPAPPPIMFDVDGDALADVITCKNQDTMQFYRRLSVSRGFDAPIEFSSHANPLDHVPYFCNIEKPGFTLLDADGDGTPNLLVHGWGYADGWAMLRYTVPDAPPNAQPVLSWQANVFNDVGYSATGYALRVGDFNGDQLYDVWGPATPEKGVLWLNTGSGNFRPQSVTHPLPVVPPGYEVDKGADPPKNDLRRLGIIDYNFDGRDDFLELWDHATSTGGTRLNLAFIPVGLSGFMTRIEDHTIVDPRFSAGLPGRWLLSTDVDGDGALDLISEQPGPTDDPDYFETVYFGRGAHNLLLKRITDGAGKFIRVDEYDGGAYQVDANCQHAVEWPDACMMHLSGLVRRHTEGVVTAVGSQDHEERSYVHSYTNAHTNRTGYGWLGFERHQVTEFVGGQSVRSASTEYEPVRRVTLSGAPSDGTSPGYVYPFAGMPRVSTVLASGLQSELTSGIFSRQTRTVNTWDVALSASGRPFPKLNERNTYIEEGITPATSNAPPPDLQTVAAFHESFNTDLYGNIKFHSLARTDGPDTDCDGTETTTTFTPDAANWLIAYPDFVTTIGHRIDQPPLTQEWDPEYDALGLLKSMTRAPGTNAQHKTEFVRNAFGNPEQIIETAAGEVTQRTTGIVYDVDQVYPDRITSAKNQPTEVRFDSRWGTPKTSIDPNDIAVQQSYDDFGRLLETRGPAGTSIYSYSATVNDWSFPEGSVTSRMAVAIEREGALGTHGGSVMHELDSHGRRVRSHTTGFGGVDVTTEQRYDGAGRLSSVTLPHLAEATGPPDTATVPRITYSYDALDRVTRETRSADGTFVEHQYASAISLSPEHAGWQSYASQCSVDIRHDIDEDSHENVAFTDHHGAVVKSIDGNNIATGAQSSSYKYDAFGRLKVMSDNLGFTTTFVSDAYGRRSSVRDPDSGETTYTYNGYDELKTSFDPKAQLRTLNYDTLGRLETITDSSGVTRWSYDEGPNAIGRLSSTTAPGSAGPRVSYSYEPLSIGGSRGLLKTITYRLDGVDYVVGFAYDDLGQIKQIQYPSMGTGQPIVAEYRYDSGILSSIDEVGGQRRPLWSLDTAFQGYLPKREVFGNGAVTSYGYHDGRHWLQSIDTTLSNGNPVQSIAYGHYNNGQIFDRTEQGENRLLYGYDSLKRLSSIDELSPPTPRLSAILYDDIGNLKRHPAAGPSTDIVQTYQVGRPHLIDTIQTAAGGNSYVYDANGNVRSRTGPDIPGGFQSIQYTPFDLPLSITTGSGSSAKATTFEYSATGNRVIRRDPEVTRYFVGNVYQRAVSASPTDTIEERFELYAEGRPIGEIVRAAGADKTLYFHRDHLGTINAISSSTSGEAIKQHFDAFGVPRAGETAATRAGFTGHQHDRDLGLIDMKGRVYDALSARFTSADPVSQAPFWSQGLNRYSYVFNDPINMTDPSGFSAVNDFMNDAVHAFVDVGFAVSAGAIVLGFAGGATAPMAAGPSLTRGGSGALGTPGGGTFKANFGIPEKGEDRRTAAVQGFCLRDGAGHCRRGAWWEQILLNLQLMVPMEGVVIEEAGVGGRLLFNLLRARAPSGGGNLAAHEAAGGHLIAKHVGKTVQQLAERLVAEPHIPAASTFESLEEAESAAASVLKANEAKISKWVADGAKDPLVIDAAVKGGTVLERGATAPVAGQGARLVLEGMGGESWRITTGFPLPQ